MAHILAAMGANVFAVAVVGFTIVIGRVTDEVILPGLCGEGPAVWYGGCGNSGVGARFVHHGAALVQHDGGGADATNVATEFD